MRSFPTSGSPILKGTSKTFASTCVVSLVLYALVICAVALDRRSSFGVAKHVTDLLGLPLRPQLLAIIVLSLLFLPLPLMVHSLIRLTYSSDHRIVPQHYFHYLWHPIGIFFTVWLMSAGGVSDGRTRRDIILARLFLVRCLVLVVAVVYLSSSYEGAT